MDTTSHNIDPTDDALLTAYALGELEGAELAAAERLLAQDPAARNVVSEVRKTAAWLTDSFKGAPDVGLTAIHIAGIERQLAAYAEVDAPQPESLPLRRNWGLWGSVAASTLIVSMVMANVLPVIFQETRHGTPGGSGQSGTPGPAASPTPSSSDGLIVSSSPTGLIGRLTASASDAQTNDWPILKTSAGGMPWPSISSTTGFPETAFVVSSDFPFAIIPPTPRLLPDQGSMGAIQSSLKDNRLPSPQSVRADELVNALQYDLSAAHSSSPVSAIIETAVCPWNSGHLLVRVAVRTSGQPGTVDAESIVPFAPEIVPLVRDLHLAVEVNPAVTQAYRVIGYENGPQSWGEWAGRDDRIVMPPGTTFTVLLEVVPAGQDLPPSTRPPEPRRYANTQPMAVTSDDLLTVSVVYNEGPSSTPARLDKPVRSVAVAIESASTDFRAAAGAAAFGLSLRNANPFSDPLLDTAIKLLADVTATEPAEDRQNLLDLAKKVKALGH